MSTPISNPDGCAVVHPSRNMDQLNLERASGKAFQEFQEGPLCFAPTYKYIPGTRDLDTRRVPSSARFAVRV